MRFLSCKKFCWQNYSHSCSAECEVETGDATGAHSSLMFNKTASFRLRQNENLERKATHLLPTRQVGDLLPSFLVGPDAENNALREGIEVIHLQDITGTHCAFTVNLDWGHSCRSLSETEDADCFLCLNLKSSHINTSEGQRNPRKRDGKKKQRT